MFRSGGGKPTVDFEVPAASRRFPHSRSVSHHHHAKDTGRLTSTLAWPDMLACDA